ncbi:MAG: YihY/virulence factor BrkB family protein, partial [Pirellulales bacterium]|nr:YihY/virulence factor BrkB family protein [Pirellulales bacterium]
MLGRAARVFHLLRQTVSQWNDDDGNSLAAAMAFYAAFSFFPLLLVLTSALGMALRVSAEAQSAQRELVQMIAENTSPWLGDQIEHMLAEVRLRAPLGGPVGLVTLCIGAIGIFAQCERAFDRIWKTNANSDHHGWKAAVRSALVTRVRAFVMLISSGLLVVAVFIIGVILSTIRTIAVEWAGEQTAWHGTQLLIGLAISMLCFSLIYKFLPRTKIRWRDAWIGAIVAASAWQIGQSLLVALVIGTRYTAYGIIGSFIAMMIWAYFSSAMLLLGAEMVHVLGQSAREPRE